MSNTAHTEVKNLKGAPSAFASKMLTRYKVERIQWAVQSDIRPLPTSLTVDICHATGESTNQLLVEKLTRDYQVKPVAFGWAEYRPVAIQQLPRHWTAR